MVGLSSWGRPTMAALWMLDVSPSAYYTQARASSTTVYHEVMDRHDSFSDTYKSIKWLHCYYWEFSIMVASFDLFESQNISYLDIYLPSIHMPSSNLSTFQPSLTKKVRAKSYLRKSSSKKQAADTSQDKASFLRIRSGISFSLSNTFPIWGDYLPLFLGSSRWESLVVSLEKQFM